MSRADEARRAADEAADELAAVAGQAQADVEQPPGGPPEAVDETGPGAPPGAVAPEDVSPGAEPERPS